MQNQKSRVKTTFRSPRKYGWIPDLPDQRDFVYSVPRRTLAALPASTDLTKHDAAIYDQGALGSCTANAIGAAHHFEQIRQAPAKAFTPSRLFIYYNERVIEGTVNEDSGAMLRDGIKSVVKQGVCPEAEWPYVIGRFSRKPSPPCYTHALEHQVVSYRRLAQDLNQMKGCLASGTPFVFGFSVYESFESATVARTGKVPMPGKGEPVLGGHAVMAVGYSDADRRFLVRNSWGTTWGKKGYFTMPYDYLTGPGLSADFWTIQTVEI